MNAPATIGHNRSPDELFAEHIADLMEEASHFLDGGGVKSQDEADAIGKILDMARTVRKDADAARAAEKKPHDDAGKAVQAKWKPIIDRADLAADTCKKALAPFLAAEQARKEAIALEERRVADEKAAAAIAARRAANETDLAARECAEEAQREADRAARTANRAEKDKASAAGGARAVTLRTVPVVSLVNPMVALAHYRDTRPEELKAWLLSEAEKDARAGKREIPGFGIVTREVAQ